MKQPLTLVLGGAASGKSAYAERLALTGAQTGEMAYIATAQAFDDEMRSKIAQHQTARIEDGWTTYETPLDVASLLTKFSAADTVLLDCATLWLTNQMMAETDLTEASATLTRALLDCEARVVVVTNEVGQGIVPEHAMSRQFREAQGTLNQMIAADADLVVQVIAGLPQCLKGQLP